MNLFLTLLLSGALLQHGNALAPKHDTKAKKVTTSGISKSTKKPTPQLNSATTRKATSPKSTKAHSATKSAKGRPETVGNARKSIKFVKTRNKLYTFKKLVALAKRHAYEIKASESCINEARSCYILGQFNYIFPDITVQASIGRSARILKDVMQPVWEGRYDTLSSHRTYYNRDVTLEVSYQLSKLYDQSQQSELYGRYISELCNNLHKNVNFEKTVFLLLYNLKLKKRRVVEYEKAVNAFMSARIAIEDKLESGEIYNESRNYNDTTLGQIVTKESEARARYLEAKKQYYAHKQDLRLVLNRRIPSHCLETVQLPEIKRIPKVHALMLRNPNMMKAYSTLIHATARDGRQKIHTFIPNIKLFGRGQFSHEEYGYLYLYLPLRISVGATLEHRFSMEQVIQIGVSKYELSSARRDYCEQHKTAFTEACAQIHAIAHYLEMLYTYNTAVEENEKEKLRFEEKYKQDPYNHVLAQQYGEAVLRWADSEEHLVRHISMYAELYFAKLTPLPRNLHNLHLPTPRSTLDASVINSALKQPV